MRRHWNTLRDIPIRQKLRRFQLMTSLISGLCTTAMLVLIVWNVEYRKAEHEAGLKAGIVAENALPALLLRDSKTAEEILARLGRDSEVLGARIIEPNGRIFASFRPPDGNPGGAKGIAREGLLRMRVNTAIVSGGERLATLEVESDRGYVVAQILFYGGAVLLSMVLSMLIGNSIAVHLQRVITDPLSALVALMKNVSVDGNLSQRATITTQDEIGELGEGFNRMIAHIEQRNTALGNELAERQRVEQRLEHQALHDQVTGLPNRHFFRRRTDELMRDTAPRQGSRALLFIDLDNFKYVNDTFGHDCGDRLLIVVGERLSAAVRATDMVVRFGGDEFVVVLDQIANLPQAQLGARKVLDAVIQPFKMAEQNFFITCSIGVAMAAGPSENFDELLKKADAAMYVAKSAGKNGIRLWEPSMSNESRTRFELEAELHQALDNHELELHYQPIIELATGRIAGLEALMRWHHPARGPVSPAVFIPIAEDSGLIVRLGEWAMLTAFSQAARWNARFDPLFMAVNVSGRQFRDHAFASKAQTIARASGLAYGMCELEVTETMVMGHSGEAARILGELSAAGFSLSLDDFGTGYSSLAYLKRFALDKLKIDRSFVMDLPDDVEDAAITEAIVGLAKTLSMRTVAEGIETAAQAAMLRQLGCQYGQGYFFSRPLPAEQVAAFIANNQAEHAHRRGAAEAKPSLAR
ncbi:MAG: hypothetical protein A3F78_16315 [Burkholderiales bacterium RIFCSPLOWO2_12_FULL_61_40]|nr:MAG: hypothetical protein A3F78_16315 [Burkholderiales bacterium RIFCSPLOWO2_12_FULL_61_40]